MKESGQRIKREALERRPHTLNSPQRPALSDQLVQTQCQGNYREERNYQDKPRLEELHLAVVHGCHAIQEKATRPCTLKL
jgi:hypothetical protein